MSKFEVLVSRVKKVENHPNADRLSLVYINDYRCVSAKLNDGSPRYKEGELVVYVPEGTIVPEYLLKFGFWDENKGKGILAGTHGNRVKAIKLRDIVSQGIIFPVQSLTEFNSGEVTNCIINHNDETLKVNEGDNVAEFMNFKKYEPIIPSSMAGDVLNIGPQNTVKYDIENLKKIS